MDPSALIFIAVAVAWAVYLIPKALEHHNAERQSRHVETFSDSLRVVHKHDPAEVRAAERARVSPAARRRRVLIALLGLFALVTLLATFGALSWAWEITPVVLIVGWLGMCRVMVKGERRSPARGEARGAGPARRVARAAARAVVRERTQAVARVEGADALPGRFAEAAAAGWAPVASPLPTYLAKAEAEPAARSELDFDATGAWSSGHDEADSALVAWAEADREATLRALAEQRARDAV